MGWQPTQHGADPGGELAAAVVAARVRFCATPVADISVCSCVYRQYCSVGTVGAKLLAGQRNKQQRIEVDKKTYLDVKCSVEYLSFSAHADAAGIEELIRMCEPRNVMLVHGEKGRIAEFKAKVVHDFGIPCFDPPNGTTITVHTPMLEHAVHVSSQLLKDKRQRVEQSDGLLRVYTPPPVEAVVVLRADGEVHLVAPHQAGQSGAAPHELAYAQTVRGAGAAQSFARIQQLLAGEAHAVVGSTELHLKTFVARLLERGAELQLSWNQQDNDFVKQRVLANLTMV